MMLDVLLMRHAKSSWKDPELFDHDRPLNDRGRRDAPRMAHRMLDAGLCPIRIVTSSARRTQETVERMLPTLGAIDVEVSSALYHAEPATILSIAGSYEGTRGPLLIVGHNPGMEMVVSAVARTLTPFPTAALAHIQLDAAGPADIVG